MRMLIGGGLFFLVFFSLLNGFVIAHIFSAETQYTIASLRSHNALPPSPAQEVMFANSDAQNMLVGRDGSAITPAPGGGTKGSSQAPALQTANVTQLAGAKKLASSDLAGAVPAEKPANNSGPAPAKDAGVENEAPGQQPSKNVDIFAEFRGQLPAGLIQRPYIVQVGAFLKQGNAKGLADRLQLMNIATVVSVKPVGEQTWYAVVAGPFSVPSDAYNVARKIQASLGLNPIVRPTNSPLVRL